jgi:hypothetical protein
MAPIFRDRALRWDTRPTQVYRDVALRREPFMPPFGSEAFPELLWPAPDFLDIPPLRWSQLFPAGPSALWAPFVDVRSHRAVAAVGTALPGCARRAVATAGAAASVRRRLGGRTGTAAAARLREIVPSRDLAAVASIVGLNHWVGRIGRKAH